MLQVHDTSAAHSDIYKELEMEKYGSEPVRTDGKQDDARKARRKIGCSGWQLEGKKEYKRVKEWIVKVMVCLYSLLEPQIQIQIS